MDAIVTLPDSRLALEELKTCGQDIGPESDYVKRLRIDAQISLYFDAAKKTGHDVQTVLYDIIRKPTIRPKSIPVLDDAGLKIVLDQTNGQRVFKKDGEPRRSATDGQIMQIRIELPQEYGDRLTADIGERPDFYFARYEIPRLDADLIEARFEFWQMGQLLRDCEKFGRWPRNTGSCIGFGRCPYFELCTGGYEIESGIIPAGFVRVDDVHQELVTE
jgi:hypothetical protein